MEEKKKKSKLKIIIPIVIVIIAVVGIVAVIGTKGNNTEDKSSTSQEPTNCYHIGETVKTDIAELTLNSSELTIALSNTINEDYGTPKEYNAQTDNNNPLVAKTGHTFAYADFTITYTGRGGHIDIQSSIASVKYNNKSYTGSRLTAEKSIIATGYGQFASNKWKRLDTTNSLLDPTDKSSFRWYADIGEDITNLKDKYYITFQLSNSKGEKEKFTYIVNE